jgi:hypothetical protein
MIMKQLTATARTTYIAFMIGAVILDVVVSVWLFAESGTGLGIGFLLAGAWIAPVTVHVLVHAIADSAPVTRSRPSVGG